MSLKILWFLVMVSTQLKSTLVEYFGCCHDSSYRTSFGIHAFSASGLKWLLTILYISSIYAMMWSLITCCSCVYIYPYFGGTVKIDVNSHSWYQNFLFLKVFSNIHGQQLNNRDSVAKIIASKSWCGVCIVC